MPDRVGTIQAAAVVLRSQALTRAAMSIGAHIPRTLIVALAAWLVASCGGSGSAALSVGSGNTLALTLIEGQAFWLPQRASQSSPITGSVTIGWDDQIWSSPESAATLQLADGSQIRMSANTRITLHRPDVVDTRPVFQLLTGAISVSARSDGFLVESYREVPLSLRIFLVNLVLEPKSKASEFDLAFVEDTAEASVSEGLVDVRYLEDGGTLQARWRARLVPGESLRIVPPLDFTATIPPNEITPSATPTITPTPSPTATPTPTATVTRRPVTRTPTATIEVPTNTPESNSGGGEEPPPPRPTKSPPTVPPPTEPPPPPPPTDTPEPRPTPGG